MNANQIVLTVLMQQHALNVKEIMFYINMIAIEIALIIMLMFLRYVNLVPMITVLNVLQKIFLSVKAAFFALLPIVF